jgi:hypothetical protein
MPAKRALRRQSAGASVDVSRIEFENIASEVAANRRRFERLEAAMQRLTGEFAELKKQLKAPKAGAS